MDIKLNESCEKIIYLLCMQVGVDPGFLFSVANTIPHVWVVNITVHHHRIRITRVTSSSK